jgi:hypothetical protein
MNKMGLSRYQILAIEAEQELRWTIIRELDQIVPNCQIFFCEGVAEAIANLRVMDWYDLVVLGTGAGDTPRTVNGKLSALRRYCQNVRYVVFADRGLDATGVVTDAIVRKPSIQALADAVIPLLP